MATSTRIGRLHQCVLFRIMKRHRRLVCHGKPNGFQSTFHLLKSEVFMARRNQGARSCNDKPITS